MHFFPFLLTLEVEEINDCSSISIIYLFAHFEIASNVLTDLMDKERGERRVSYLF